MIRYNDAHFKKGEFDKRKKKTTRISYSYDHKDKAMQTFWFGQECQQCQSTLTTTSYYP